MGGVVADDGEWSQMWKGQKRYQDAGLETLLRRPPRIQRWNNQKPAISYHDIPISSLSLNDNPFCCSNLPLNLFELFQSRAFLHFLAGFLENRPTAISRGPLAFGITIVGPSDMGGCCSCEISCGDKVIRHMDDREYGRPDQRQDIAYEDSGARIRLRGSSKFVSMYCQQGSKGINQDALTVWEGFSGEKDMIFCGVFDGHGPLGHKVSQYIRDNLPAKICESIKMTQHRKVRKLWDPYPRNRSSHVNVHGGNDQNMSLASWERSLVTSFSEMDGDVARDINTDSFSSGTTAVTVIQQGDELIIANLGDSRAVLCTRGANDELNPVQLTVDLKPDIPSEATRIQNCEGRVFAAAEESHVHRIYMPDEDCPGLAMSRAFGDFCLKDYGLISVPDVFHRKITKHDEFVVLATDGIWDVLSNAEVISIVASAPRRSMAAKMLVRHAVSIWRYKYPHAKIDDCAVICLFLHEEPTFPDSPSAARSNVNKRKHLSPHDSKPTRHEGAESSVDDGKSSIITLGQELDARGRLSRANSVSNSKYPRLSRVVSRKSSHCVDGVEVY